jgi:hypothetical protein
MAVSRLDGRGFRYPEPVPRIWTPSRRRYQSAEGLWARSADDRGALSPRFGESHAATLTRIAAWRFLRPAFRVALSLAADFRRART